MKPIIGLTMSKGEKKGYHAINNYYIDAVFAAGGIPINIPIREDEKDLDKYIELIDGIIFIGGVDIWPLLYGENPLKQTHVVSAERDRYELSLFKKAYEIKLPILGICKGAQVINVGLGGNLYQDIDLQVAEALGHQPIGISEDELYHSIIIDKDTQLYDVFESEKIYVNSNHHQSIKELGDNLIVSALSEDGIIEAIEASDERYLMGLQFHPECLVKKHSEFLNIFKQLVVAAKFK